MKHAELFDLSDDRIKDLMTEAVHDRDNADQLIFDCGWHLAIRTNINKASLQRQIDALQAQMKKLEG